MKEGKEEIEKKIKEVNNLKNIISKKIFEENKKQKNVVKKDDLKIKEKFEEKEEKAIIKQVATSSKYFVVTDPNVEIKVKKINKKEKAKSEPLNEKQLKSEKQTSERFFLI